LRELQCPVPRWAAERRNLLQPARGTNPDRAMEATLQHEATTQCLGLPSTGSEDHRRNGPNAGRALTIKLDHSGGADHIAWNDRSIPSTTRSSSEPLTFKHDETGGYLTGADVKVCAARLSLPTRHESGTLPLPRPTQRMKGLSIKRKSL